MGRMKSMMWAVGAGLACVLGTASLAGGQAPACCPVGTGQFDGFTAQRSQLPPGWTGVQDYRVADDFYLAPGRVYEITSATARMLTNSINSPLLRKARVEIYEDCDGLPGALIKAYDGTDVTVTSTGQTSSGSLSGYDLVDVRATIPSLWLKGGKSYWISFIGAGTAGTPNEDWAWGSAGFGVIQGKPGVFKSVSGGYPTWVSTDQICCGCTDFNFCIGYSSCKVLLNNGTFDNASGTKSIDNGANAAQLVKSADDFVVPPCDNATVCYIEAYIATNCENFRLDLWSNSCNMPGQVVRTGIVPTAVIPTGEFYSSIENGITVRLPIYCLQFSNFSPALSLAPGQYWLSAYGLGNGSFNQRAYFLNNKDCKRTCLINFNAGKLRGAGLPSPYNTASTWTPSGTLGASKDYAFTIAIRDGFDGFASPGATNPTCAADIDGNRRVEVTDIFAYLSAYFTGCP